jgi:hypothetical protein
MGDFPDFDAAYKTVLVKDINNRFEQLAAEANFNIYHSDIWHGTARRFAELIVKDCANTIQDFVDHRFPASEYPLRLKKSFDIDS